MPPKAHVEPTATPERNASDMSSSLSSHTSWSDDPNDLDREVVERPDNNNEFARRLIEMSRMSDEDQRSQAYMAHLRAVREQEMQKARDETEQMRVQKERDIMETEDMLSRQARRHLKQKGRIKPNNNNNFKANAQIQKAVNRLREARERKELLSKAKLDLPSITRKIPTTKLDKRVALNQVPTNNEPKIVTDIGHLKRRQKLLMDREKRLQTKQKLKNEADLERRRKLKEQHDIEQHETQIKEKLIADERRRREEARRLKMLKKNAEMERLEKELRMKESLKLLENKENASSTFRSLSHWNKTLYGQK
jgi:hypothetical protein